MHIDFAMRFDIWTAVLGAGLVALSIAAYRRTAPPLPAGRRAVLRALRAAGFTLLVLLVVNPAIVTTRTETRRPLVLVLLDRSRSMGIRDAGGRGRIDAALEDAAHLRREFSRRRADVLVLPFAGTPAPAPLPADSVVAPDRDGTDIRGALDAVRDRYPGGVAAVVLLSDGRVTRGMVSSGGAAFAPVFAVGYGDTARSADVSVEEVVADRVAYRGTAVPVEAVVRAEGYRGSAVEVRLLEDGRSIRSTVLSVRRDSELLGVAFDYVPGREGTRLLTIEAVPARAERDRDNNSESIRIDVRKERIRLLYVDQRADWNSAFIRDLAGRSKRLEGEIALGTAGSGFVLDPGGTPWTFPQTAAGLARYNLVSVSDDARLFAARENVETLVRYVEEGGSVLFLADEESPMARDASFGLLERALPVRRAGTPRVVYAEGFVKASTDAAGDRFAATLGLERAIASMPPLPARIGGVVPSAGAAAPFSLESGGAAGAFLAIDRRGDGLTAAVLGFPLWRWKLAGGEGARVYEAFLGGLVQYLAEGAKSPALALDADRTVYRSGDRVRLTASTGDREASGTIRGELGRAGDASGAARTFLFEPDIRRRGVHRAVLDALPPGSYTVVAFEAPPGADAASSPAAFSVEPLSVELLDISRDGAFLARIAGETGGAYVERAALDSIVAACDLSGRSVEHRRTRELRGSMLAFFGLVAFLGAEWIARKAWGLV
jgi:hypothetical protein